MRTMVKLGDNVRVGRYALMEERLTRKDSSSGLERELLSDKQPMGILRSNTLYSLQTEGNNSPEDAYIQTAFNKAGLRLSYVMGFGTPVVGEDGKVYFLLDSLVDKLSERGIAPQNFHLYERITELYRRKFGNGAVTFVAEEEKRIPLVFDPLEDKETLRLSKSDKVKNLFLGKYRDDPFESSHVDEHDISKD